MHIGLLMVMLLSIGTFYYHNQESWTYVDSLYFSSITLTTIGYGDLHPTTDASKVFTVVYAVLGVGFMLYFFSTIIGSYINHQEEHFDKVVGKLHHLSPLQLKNRLNTNTKKKTDMKSRKKENKFLCWEVF